jgi:beta-N-acetylhexosaminidase
MLSVLDGTLVSRQLLLFLLMLPPIFQPSSLYALDFNSVTITDETSITLAASIIVDGMSDEEAMAQTMMFGWRNSENDASVENILPAPRLIQWIRERGAGGIKIFGINTPQAEYPSDDQRMDVLLGLVDTIGKYQMTALERKGAIPLFVATDQEGGMVRHVRGATLTTPGNMALGASGVPHDAYLEGYYIGRELSLLGINMNFAPAVDTLTNTRSTVISTRSFGDDPVAAGILGAAFARGHTDAGIIATAKHFPGHGDTDRDSHSEVPQILADMETLRRRELVPYRILSREGVPAVMSGHLAFPNTKGGKTSASLSSYFINDVLRNEIGFKGLVITDDIMMNGATINAGGSLTEAAKKALLAGNDMILFTNSPGLYAPVWTNLSREMKIDVNFNTRVRDAARRVIETKLRFFKSGNAPPLIPDKENVKREIAQNDARLFYKDLASRAATIVRQKDGALPLSPEKAGRVLLAGQHLSFFDAGKSAYPGAAGYWYSPQTIDGFWARAAASDTVIISVSDNSYGLGILRNLRNSGRRVIVISTANPARLSEYAWVDGALAVYGSSPECFLAGFSLLRGKIPAWGKVPLGR